jgi:phosphonate transport system ATP-binding protein
VTSAATSAGFRLEGASVRYGAARALEGVDLEIAPGEAVAFVGPSGAGKTTLLRLLNGTVRPTEGRVWVDGRELGSLPPRRLRAVRATIGFIHQDLSLVPNLRVSQNVISGGVGRQSFLGSLKSVLRPSKSELLRAHEILEQVGIGEKLFERTDRLSGGQRQRVAVARALYQGPAALLADEPVSSVDPARARDTIDLLTRVCREKRLTLVASLHHLDLAREFFPRLVGLRAGRVAFDRRAADLYDADLRDLYALTAAEMLADGA